MASILRFFSLNLGKRHAGKFQKLFIGPSRNNWRAFAKRDGFTHDYMQCKYQGLLIDAMKIAIKNCQCTELHSMDCLIYKFVCKVDYKRTQDCSRFLKKTLTFDRVLENLDERANVELSKINVRCYSEYYGGTLYLSLMINDQWFNYLSFSFHAARSLHVDCNDVSQRLVKMFFQIIVFETMLDDTQGLYYSKEREREFIKRSF